MPVNIKSTEIVPAGVQQFQADQPSERDQRARSTQMGQDEPLLDAGDISLAMRQFFQSPVRSAG